MIAFSKAELEPRFNPVLGSSYKMDQKVMRNGVDVYYRISFTSSNQQDKYWDFKTLEAAQQTLEWLDHLYGVKFIPSEIIELENKENH